ncbi:PREDICTED: mitotic-spindle organizing protein 2-like [Amphimedon queenslandica]|uniref:Uncharacterized protein n=1 Tax=Amphimedon queenslandica TaxID=400682 RepID=A0A1X7SH61_AMPQE|nr:PREDICTED: mitotic-spindle organizing protein 2-like [Amphimedon queenslandica]|eukprot:XP_019863922.1 PREDICTED: mitotic-spindle organizing protein 2-like [Amphimedon queenslandica]
MAAEGGKERYKFSAKSFQKSSYEKELFELVELSEVPLDHDLFKVILELLKENVAPSAIVHVLKALRSASESSAHLEGSTDQQRTGHSTGATPDINN